MFKIFSVNITLFRMIPFNRTSFSSSHPEIFQIKTSCRALHTTQQEVIYILQNKPDNLVCQTI